MTCLPQLEYIRFILQLNITDNQRVVTTGRTRYEWVIVWYVLQLLYPVVMDTTYRLTFWRCSSHDCLVMVVMTTKYKLGYNTCRVILNGAIAVVSLPVNNLMVGVGKCRIITLPDSSPYSRYDDTAGCYWCSHGLVATQWLLTWGS